MSLCKEILSGKKKKGLFGESHPCKLLISPYFFLILLNLPSMQCNEMNGLFLCIITYPTVEILNWEFKKSGGNLYDRLKITCIEKQSLEQWQIGNLAVI